MTNIVFTATMQLVLAAFNQFAEQAQLDLPLPIQEKDITEMRGQAELHRSLIFIIKNRHRFGWFMTHDLRGKINYDDLKFSTLRMDREVFLPSLTNVPSLITTNEALKIAERTFQRLGYDKSKEFRPPPIVGQFTYQTSLNNPKKPVPLFGIQWLPKKKNSWRDCVFRIEVSGITKKVTSVKSLTFERTIVDLRQFMTNTLPEARAPLTNKIPVETLPPK